MNGRSARWPFLILLLAVVAWWVFAPGFVVGAAISAIAIGVYMRWYF